MNHLKQKMENIKQVSKSSPKRRKTNQLEPEDPLQNQKKSNQNINVFEEPKSCHQCHRNDNDRVVECNKCRSNKYCLGCITNWYPDVSEEKIAEACPVCCNNCNCKACLHGFLLKGYSCSEPEKIRYSKHIIQNVFLLVKNLNEEQLTEKEIEAEFKGLPLSKVQLQNTECEADDDKFCNSCGSDIFDYYRSCSCGFVLCLTCCRELRDGQHKSLTCGWKVNVDSSISCPPKHLGGCNVGILNLKRIIPRGWVAYMLEEAKGIYKVDTIHNVSQTSMKCIMCYDNGNEYTSRLYSVSAKDIQPQDTKHFQFHWSKGEPVIVNDVLSTSSGLSWEPLVMWRAFCDIAKTTIAINRLDWSEVTIDLLEFFKGYSEDRSMILKLEDWQPSCLSEGVLPRHFVEFINFLPFKDYTHPNNGYLNVAVKLPDLSLKPNLGPKMDIGYGDSLTKLHYDISDTVNVLTHTQSVFRNETNDDQVGALWDIFRKQDVSNLEKFLRAHSTKFSHVNRLSVEEVVHPIHDRTFYLKRKHKRKLKVEFGIEPWTFKQKLGDAVFIPAGCPYQVRNLKSCTKVKLNFISPESLSECIRLQYEIRMLPNNHRAKQQKLNIKKMMIYALDHAVTDLAGVTDSVDPTDELVLTKVPEIINGDTVSDASSHKTAALSLLDLITSIRRSSSLEVNHTVDHSVPSNETVGLWRGNDVGPEAKKLFQAVERRYPNTFHRVQIRPKPYWLFILKGLHVVLKSFLETSVDALTDEQMSSLQEDLNNFERSGFDLSWACNRLEMVKDLKFGNDLLRQELVSLDESLELVQKELVEAEERVKKARADNVRLTDTRNKKVREMEDKFGGEYDRVLKGQLGFGMLPEY